MPTPLNVRFAVKPDVIFRVLGVEAIVLNLDGGLYFGLNEVGTRIWSLLEEHDGEEVSRRLAAEYDVTLDQARADVSALIDDLVSRGLLVRADAPR